MNTKHTKHEECQARRPGNFTIHGLATKLAVSWDIPFWQVPELLEHACQTTSAVSCLLLRDSFLMAGCRCIIERILARDRRVLKTLAVQVRLLRDLSRIHVRFDRCDSKTFGQAQNTVDRRRSRRHLIAFLPASANLNESDDGGQLWSAASQEVPHYGLVAS